ncbi:aconitate hydratase [Planctomycetales bacterium]|nr:aconitate hydratase [Planctomycetales bacterium]
MNALQTLTVNNKTYSYYSLASIGGSIDAMPFSIRILLESVLRNCDGFQITEQDVKNLAAYKAGAEAPASFTIPFKPARVILQDFTGVPAVVDLAAMRSAMQRLGGDPNKINPLIPVDLVIDHSIQTDYCGTDDCLQKNVNLEFQRNAERYALLNWAQKSLSNFRVIPPSVGIIHQVNLEYLADVVHIRTDSAGTNVLYPDSCLGTDSHTVMVNGLSVLGWGVGGIEAEAVMLGQPYYMLAPQVVGFELTGRLNEGITATDLVLTITEILRKEKVVGKFVEYFGEGAASMTVADRAVVANMAPEYGATMGYFPVDDNTLQYLRETGRDEEHVQVVEAYCKANQLFNCGVNGVRYAKTLSLDLSTVESCVAGPKRPQDRITLKSLAAHSSAKEFSPAVSEQIQTLTDHSVVIAAITSCTNTSNPKLMLAAGLLAKKAVEKGLTVPLYVKTSLAPGSRVVADYLTKSGLLKPLEQLGFNIAGYGCMTCIGNSGTLKPEIEKDITEKNLTVAAVLSGNRNFEGRINPFVKENYLASPPLVIAFALAGRMNIDLTSEPLGKDKDGKPVFLRDIFPSNAEVEEVAKNAVDAAVYRSSYQNVFNSNEKWNAVKSDNSLTFNWDKSSTYIQEPPFCDVSVRTCSDNDRLEPVANARVLALLGDSVTTDHISPAGNIKADSPAGKYLTEHGVQKSDFNSYGSRRGNDRIMTRGTFANIRIKNQLVPNIEGGITKHFPSGEILPIYEAAMRYKEEGIPLIVIAGKEYGTGSSRDWAAKGTVLLGVRAVIAESFERIHRGNLAGMGVLPLEFANGATWQSLQLTGEEEFTIPALAKDFNLTDLLTVKAERPVIMNGREMFAETEFQVKVRIDTPVELQYYLNGGILPAVLNSLMKS